jgi:hypothetical protein
MNSREKGKRGERRWRDVLREAGFLKAYRGVQYAGGNDSPDVACPELPSIHFEVKAVEALNIWRAMDQSIRDAGTHKTPVVAHTRNRSGWLVTMRADDWLILIRDSAHVTPAVGSEIPNPRALVVPAVGSEISNLRSQIAPEVR